MIDVISVYFFILASVIVEALAHYAIQSWTWGMSPIDRGQNRDREYHIYFFWMWATIYTVAVILSPWHSVWPVLLIHAVFRRGVFSWLLNACHNKSGKLGSNRSLHYLSDNGVDGLIKRTIGEYSFFIFMWLATIAASFLYFYHHV